MVEDLHAVGDRRLESTSQTLVRGLRWLVNEVTTFYIRYDDQIQMRVAQLKRLRFARYDNFTNPYRAGERSKNVSQRIALSPLRMGYF